HVLTGTLFGLLGPLQFFNVLRHRFGLLHRLTGWVFVLSGWALGLSGWGLLMGVEHISTELLVVARGIFGLALIAALVQAVLAALAGDIVRHRAWMIRAYVIGMGSGTAGLVMLPIYLATGEPVYGLFSDIVVIGMWLISILVGEWVIRRLAFHKPQLSTAV
ncbi:MAG: DUF2306 domain-containing protein, partial [Hydrogenophaga sp.]|nr:DUF2306 domain-containing protein [Hydrogenophaga sp.]